MTFNPYINSTNQATVSGSLHLTGNLTVDGNSTLKGQTTIGSTWVNYFQFAGGNSGVPITLSAQGGDTNIHMDMVTKGNGIFNIFSPSTNEVSGLDINGTVYNQSLRINQVGGTLDSQVLFLNIPRRSPLA